MLTYQIINGDNRKVDVIPSDSVHGAFTSPPYGGIIDYDRSNPNNIGNYSDKEYKTMVTETYKEVFRVLKPGRKFGINIADTYATSLLDGKSTINEYGKMTVEICKAIGFELEVRLIWDKGRAASVDLMGSWPRPASPIINQKDEWIFIFRKPGDGDYSHITNEEKEASIMPTSFIQSHLYSVWHIKPETTMDWHPAPFPVELPESFIRMYTFPGETVYEPFLGSGTTMLAAKNWGRSCIGTEIGWNPSDGKPWLDHIKEKVGWLRGEVYSKQVAYEIVTPEGEILQTVAKGTGLERLQKKVTAGPMDSFTGEQYEPDMITPNEILFEGKTKAEKKEETVEYKPKDNWKRQQVLFD